MQVVVDDVSGQIRESWTGDQIAWQMARGYSGQFGHKLNAPYVWIPLAAIFLFGLLDFRRAGANGASRPARPALVRDLGDLLQRRGDRRQRAARLPAARSTCWRGWPGWASAAPAPGFARPRPIAWLAVGGAFLLGFRIALNVADSGVIDVGYAGVIGADHLTHGAGDLEHLPLRQPVRGHLRARSTTTRMSLRARTAVERPMGRSSGRPRGGDLLRPGDRRRPVRARPPAAAGRRGNPPRRHPGVRLGRLPVHGLRAAVELERHIGRRPAGLVPRPVRRAAVARRHARSGGRRQVRAPAPRCRSSQPARPASAGAPAATRDGRGRGSARSPRSRPPSSAAIA